MYAGFLAYAKKTIVVRYTVQTRKLPLLYIFLAKTINFTRILHVHTDAKLPHFIQLSQAFTKLCHIERDHAVNHLVNFYSLLEKREKLRYLCYSMTCLARWCRTCRKWTGRQKFNSKNPRWLTTDALERETPVLHRHEISRCFDVKMAAVRHVGFLKVKFLTANHHRDTFYITVPSCVETVYAVWSAEKMIALNIA